MIHVEIPCYRCISFDVPELSTGRTQVIQIGIKEFDNLVFTGRRSIILTNN